MPACAAGVARRRDRVHAFDEGELPLRDRNRIPAQRRDRKLDFRRGRGAPEADIELLRNCAPMRDGRSDAIEPATLVGGARRGEGRAAAAVRRRDRRRNFCGELRPTGSAPGSASVSNPLPKPVRYPASRRREARPSLPDSGSCDLIHSGTPQPWTSADFTGFVAFERPPHREIALGGPDLRPVEPLASS